MFEDLKWFGLHWQEGPDTGGPFGPYSQSERFELYRAALKELQTKNLVYPCRCSRQDVRRALQAPHLGEDEPLYPGTCRPQDNSSSTTGAAPVPGPTSSVNWRFRVPDGEAISFLDAHYGPQTFIAGVDFGDFVVWRHDDIPAYHLAVVVDDSTMQITEVVRGADLLKSTARQLLLYRAFDLPPPNFYHCPLVTDAQGARLAKRDDDLSLRTLRNQGADPGKLRESW
jgi:glutamyl-tRNA synthetase